MSGLCSPALQRLFLDPCVDGILVQHPVPAHVDERAVFEATAPAKDVGGVTMHSVGVGGRVGAFAIGLAVEVGAGVLLGSTLGDNGKRGDGVALLAGGRDSEGSHQRRAALEEHRAATPARCSGDCTRNSRMMMAKPSIDELRYLTRGAPANLGRKSR